LSLCDSMAKKRRGKGQQGRDGPGVEWGGFDKKRNDVCPQ